MSSLHILQVDLLTVAYVAHDRSRLIDRSICRTWQQDVLGIRMADLGYFGLQINVAILLIFNIVILKKHGFQNKLKQTTFSSNQITTLLSQICRYLISNNFGIVMSISSM